MAVIFMPLKDCKNCLQKIEEIIQFWNDSEADGPGFSFYVVDMSTQEELVKFYDVQVMSLGLFIHQKLTLMPYFHKIFSTPHFKEEVRDFVQKITMNIVVDIISCKQLKKKVKENKVVGVFIGEKGEEYDKYYELAAMKPQIPFYSVFNNNRCTKLLKQQYGIKSTSMLILRSREVITEMDKEIYIT